MMYEKRDRLFRNIILSFILFLLPILCLLFQCIHSYLLCLFEKEIYLLFWMFKRLLTSNDDILCRMEKITFLLKLNR